MPPPCTHGVVDASTGADAGAGAGAGASSSCCLKLKKIDVVIAQEGVGVLSNSPLLPFPPLIRNTFQKLNNAPTTFTLISFAY
eukprot:gene5182-7026_t